MTDLSGQHALVTGGGQGLGKAIAAKLSQRGAVVSLLGRRKETLESVRQHLDNPGAAVMADVTQAEQIRAAIEQAERMHGPLSILINNAGAAESAAFENTDTDLWARMIAVNLTGVYHCIQAALPSLKDAEQGRIITIASTAGLKGYGYVSAYCAAKHGVIGLTRSLAVELAKSRITVNAVCPGYAETDMLAETISNIREKTGRSEAEARASLLRDNPQGRFVQPDEVAETVAWLCGAGAASVTGQAIALAGGEVMA